MTGAGGESAPSRGTTFAGGDSSRGITFAAVNGESEKRQAEKVSVVPTYTKTCPQPTFITPLSPKQQHLQRRLVEVCCGANSILGQPGLYTHGVEHIRVTEHDDTLSEKGQFKTFGACNHPGVLVWITLECVGGSPRNHYNWVVWSTQTQLKIVAHINKFYEMFPVIDHAAEIARKNGGIIALELPKPCAYWKTNHAQLHREISTPTC